MWKKWTERISLFVVLSGVLLGISVGPSLAQPGVVSGVPDDRAQRESPVDDGPIGGQAAPSASFAAPSAAIGDFGASQGNVWDMDSTGDIVWTQEPFTLENRPGTVVRGYIPEGEDLAIAFYTSSSTNLPSGQYHHLLYKLKIAAEGNCQTNGRVLYAKSWPNWLGSQVISHGFLPHTSPMNCPFGQYCIYYMDLSSNNNDIVGPDYDTWFTDPPPWPTDGVKAFGMWPHERWANCNGGPNYFDLDYVYLTGDIVAREKDGYLYTAKWQVSDADGGTVTSTIRYQEVSELQLPSNSPTCNSSNFDTAWSDFNPVAQTTTNLSPPPSYPNKIYLPIIMGASSGGMGPYNETYTLDFTNVSVTYDGTAYYLCVRVDDGTSQNYAVSSAPVIRAPYSPNFGNE